MFHVGGECWADPDKLIVIILAGMTAPTEYGSLLDAAIKNERRRLLISLGEASLEEANATLNAKAAVLSEFDTVDDARGYFQDRREGDETEAQWIFRTGNHQKRRRDIGISRFARLDGEAQRKFESDCRVGAIAQLVEDACFGVRAFRLACVSTPPATTAPDGAE